MGCYCTVKCVFAYSANGFVSLGTVERQTLEELIGEDYSSVIVSLVSKSNVSSSKSANSPLNIFKVYEAFKILFFYSE